MEYVGMFVSNFFVVFLLGMQSKNVQQSRYVAAIMTSFGISVAQAMFVHYVSTGNLFNFMVCAVGGCFGIAAAIWTHDNLMRKENKEVVVKIGADTLRTLGRRACDPKWGEPVAGSRVPSGEAIRG
jgi:hypothetical protein